MRKRFPRAKWRSFHLGNGFPSKTPPVLTWKRFSGRDGARFSLGNRFPIQNGSRFALGTIPRAERRLVCLGKPLLNPKRLSFYSGNDSQSETAPVLPRETVSQSKTALVLPWESELFSTSRSLTHRLQVPRRNGAHTTRFDATISVMGYCGYPKRLQRRARPKTLF